MNVGAVDADHQYEQRAIPGYRQIVDLSPANDSRYMDAVGQSGHFLSRHYNDFIKPWQAVDHRPMRMDRMQINAGAIGTLTWYRADGTSILSLALGPHPQRELTQTLRLGSPCPRLSVAAGAHLPALPALPAFSRPR